MNNKLIEFLKENYPNSIVEKIDENDNISYELNQEGISDLKNDFQTIANNLEETNEFYELNWLGKSLARIDCSLPTNTLLHEDKKHNSLEENKNSHNIYIEGDNLDVLKHLKFAYANSIDMIYIDPPYNTGSDGFVYNDSRKWDVKTYAKLANITEEEAKRVLDYTSSKHSSHSAWLTFMYPRLFIARELLNDTGVIFISIDDNEQAQLKLLCDEIFGENNFLGEISVINNLAGRSDDKYFATNNEFLLVYSKSFCIENLDLGYEEDIENEKYNLKDDFGNYKLTSLKKTGKGKEFIERPTMFYPIFLKDGKFSTITTSEHKKLLNSDLSLNNDYLNDLLIKYEKEGFKSFLPMNGNELGRWRWGFDTTKNKIKENILALNSNDNICVKERATLENGAIKIKKRKTVWYDALYSTTNGGKALENLGLKNLFSNPKSVKFIKDIILLFRDKNIKILDFFSGSGTIAEATLECNVEDNGKREYIMIQLPEYFIDNIGEGSTKKQFDFCINQLNQEPTIPTIAKERIRRVAKKIKKENINEEYINDLDLGFKVFKIIEKDKEYRVNEKFNPYQTQIISTSNLSQQNIEDMLLTLAVHDGMQLDEVIQPFKIDDYKSYFVENNLYLMNKGFTSKNIKTLIHLIENEELNVSRVIILNPNFIDTIIRELSEALKSVKNIELIQNFGDINA